jgi:hypothetical protein
LRPTHVAQRVARSTALLQSERPSARDAHDNGRRSQWHPRLPRRVLALSRFNHHYPLQPRDDVIDSLLTVRSNRNVAWW